MADAIFTSGTCTKGQLYSVIINAMLAAGWTNISSNPTADFDVMQSPGETGDKNLIIQMRPTNVSNQYSIATTDYNVFSYRLIDSYTPGAAGVAGTTPRSAETWNPLYVMPTTTTYPVATIMSYWIHVNKNRLIIVIESPAALAMAPITHYIGLPDVTYVSEPGSRGVIVATSAYAKGGASVHISNTAGELASETASSSRTVYCQLAPKNPNSAGMFALSEMKYGSATEGYRGKISGLFALPTGGALNGDIITIGTKKYRIVLNGAMSANSFPSTMLAVQVA